MGILYESTIGADGIADLLHLPRVSLRRKATRAKTACATLTEAGTSIKNLNSISICTSQGSLSD